MASKIVPVSALILDGFVIKNYSFGTSISILALTGISLNELNSK